MKCDPTGIRIPDRTCSKPAVCFIDFLGAGNGPRYLCLPHLLERIKNFHHIYLDSVDRHIGKRKIVFLDKVEEALFYLEAPQLGSGIEVRNKG